MQLGAVHDPNRGVKVGGDIVDFTKREVLQIKNVSSPQVDAVLSNLKSAEKQLQGYGGELPNEGFKKVAEIHIGPNNELSKANGQTINQQITKLMRGGELKDFDGTVRMVKTNEQGVPSETLEFRVQNGRSQYSPSQTQPNKQSSLEPDNSVQIANASRSLSEVEGTTATQQSSGSIKEWLQKQIDISKELYPLPQLRNPQNSSTIAAALTNHPRSPQETLDSSIRENKLNGTLSSLLQQVKQLENLARQSPAQQVYESNEQTLAMQPEQQQKQQGQMEQG